MNDVIESILVGAAGDGTGGLLSGLITAAGVHAIQRFQQDPYRKALKQALSRSLQFSLNNIEENSSKLSYYYLQSFEEFFQKQIVQKQLSVLLEPNNGFNISELRGEFMKISQGYTPEAIKDIDFDEFITNFMVTFYQVAKEDEHLRAMIQIDRLDALLGMSERQTQLTEMIAKNSSELVNLFQQKYTNQNQIHRRVLELIKILQQRAEVINKQLNGLGYDEYAKDFEILHTQHVEALSNNNIILAHEILGRIHSLINMVRLSMVKDNSKELGKGFVEKFFSETFIAYIFPPIIGRANPQELIKNYHEIALELLELVDKK